MLKNKAIPACNEFDFRLGKLKKLYPQFTPIVNQKALREALVKLSKDDLLELLLKSCEMDRNILLLGVTKADPDGIGIQAIIHDTKNAIAEAASYPDFDDDDSSGPDYTANAKKLRTIIAARKLEIALDLTSEIFNTYSNAIEVYDHDGEMIGEAGEVVEAAITALRKVNWPLTNKLIWAITNQKIQK